MKKQGKGGRHDPHRLNGFFASRSLSGCVFGGKSGPADDEPDGSYGVGRRRNYQDDCSQGAVTNLNRDLLADETVMAKLEAKIPAGLNCEVEEIAAAVAFGLR